MELSQLEESYKEVLSSISSSNFILEKDLYSGVFLAKPFDEYNLTDKKVMVVGRETAGWNTNNSKNTISRIVACNSRDELTMVIDEAFERYSWHLLEKKGGKVRKKSTSWFQRFYLNISEMLDIDPHALIYQNLYAWDFNGESPVKRQASEFQVIQSLSIRLLSESIKFNKPNMIIFAVGCNKDNDQTIKKLCNELFNGYKTLEVVKGKYWRFTFDDIECIRIAHPRAQNEDHRVFRGKALKVISEKFV